MTEEQEIVIVDKDGKEHVFPNGFDPKKAAGIVARSSTSPDEPAKKDPSKINLRSIQPRGFTEPDGVARRAPIAARGTQLDVGGVADTMHNTAPTVGAMIGAGGGGTPGAAVGAGLGQLFKDSQWEMPTSERLSNAAKSATGALMTQGAPSALRLLGGMTRKAGSAITNAMRTAPDASRAVDDLRAVDLVPELPLMPSGSSRASIAAAGRVAHAAGRGMEKLGTSGPMRKLSEPVVKDGMKVTAVREPMLPDAIRKLQLLYRTLTGQQDNP